MDRALRPGPGLGAPVLSGLDALVARARGLPEERGGRAVLGITGPPGAGKSTLATALVAALQPSAALVGMDGFHLPQAELVARGLAERKGAPETFDAAGYVATLAALRAAVGPVRAPAFDRSVEEPVPDAVTVPATVPLVVTEGNYLLLDAGPWSGVRALLAECWYVDLAGDERLRRLVARHAAYGKAPEAALAWATGSDARNAALVEATRSRADLVVDMAGLDLPG